MRTKSMLISPKADYKKAVDTIAGMGNLPDDVYKEKVQEIVARAICDEWMEYGVFISVDDECEDC